MSSLKVANVIKRFGDTEVLKRIHIEVDAGEFLVLVGPSGCGKSTLLNMIAGLDSVSGGDIVIGARSVTHLAPKDRDIAMVFQSYALYPNMTVEKNITFGMEMRKVPRAEREEAVRRVAKLLQIDDLLNRKPGQLSGGQRQRVAMGRALVRDPQIFLFDEPLSNLDAKLRVEMRTEIKKLHQSLGTTIVYVTHDQIEAMTLASRIAVMRDGVLQQLGTPSEVYNDPANTFVATFIGSPSMNLIPGELESRDGTLGVVLAQDGGASVYLPLARPMADAGASGRREVLLGLRPESITDALESDSGRPSLHTVECAVEVTEPTGPDTLAVLMLGGAEVTARLRPDTVVVAQSRGRFSVDMSKAVLFDPQTRQRI